MQNNNKSKIGDNHCIANNISDSIQTPPSDVCDAYDTKRSYDNQHNSPGSLNKYSECMSVATSYTSYASDSIAVFFFFFV